MKKVASQPAFIGIRTFAKHMVGSSKLRSRCINTRTTWRCSKNFVTYFGCGTISSKSPNSDVMTFSIFNSKKLEAVVIPFFEANPLRVKRKSFDTFALIVRAMRNKEHLTSSGFEQLVAMAFTMNANGKQRARTLDMILEGSSETAR
jgi:membrane-bound acyltransferase YfiQ involved in biofilm formation